MSRIVISYAHQDRNAVEHLNADLELMGHSVWVDRNITGGQGWWDEVLEHIRQCDVFIFALSADSLSSDACRRENFYAHRLARVIIPVEVTETVSRKMLPEDLQQLQVVTYLNESKQEFAELARAVQGAELQPLPDPLPPPPAVPVSYLLRIQNRLSEPAAIPLQDQDSIVEWLERGLRREDERRESSALLRRMHARRELDPRVIERIDTALVGAARPTGVVPVVPSGWGPATFTSLILCALVIPLFGLVVGLVKIRSRDVRGQAAAVCVVGVLNVLLVLLVITLATSWE